MLHLVLESSVLSKDPHRQSAAFRTLLALMREKAVKLYVPDFVRDEFLSQSWVPLDNAFNQILSALKQLSRGTTSATLNKRLGRLTKQVSELKNESRRTCLHHSLSGWKKIMAKLENSIADARTI